MLFKHAVSTEDLQRRFPAIFAESQKETLSDKYLYIPTFKLVEGLQKQGFSIVGAKQSKSRSSNKEHAKHVVYMTHENMQDGAAKHLVPGTHNRINEEIPMLALTNSHNGLASFQLDTAFFRLVCSNGLLMPSTTFNSARITHKVGMEQDVIEASYKVIKAFPEMVGQVEAMKQVMLNTDETMALAESAANLVFDEEQIELNKKLGINLGAKLLTARRRDDTYSSIWSAFNKIQENVIKGGLRIVTENEAGARKYVKMRPVQAIDRDSKINKELMALALKMAEIKGA